MHKKLLVYSGGTMIVTIFLVISYLSFNFLGITQSRVKRYELTIVTESSEKVYDGTPLTNSTWYIESGELEDRDILTVTTPSSITMPGTIDNTVGITIVDEEGKVVTETYQITLKLGKLTVIPISIRVETESIDKMFDNTALTSSVWQMTAGTLLQGHHLDVLMGSSITRPGSTMNEIDVRVLDDNNQDVTQGYQIQKELGSLTVYPIELTIQTETAHKIYDGTPLSGPQWQLIQGIVRSNHTMVVDMGTAITTPQSVQNDVVVTIFDENNQDITYGYHITSLLGELTIEPRSLVIETETLSKIYDGQPLSSQVYNINQGSVAPNQRLEFVMESRIINPGSTPNDIRVTIYDQDNYVVTNHYSITYILGELSVYGRDLGIQTETLEKVYDGIPMTSNQWTIILGELIANHRIEYVMDASITNPGVVENNIQIVIKDEQNLIVTDKYNLSINLGTLTVHPINIDIITENKDKPYDGQPLTSDVWQIQNGSIAPNQRIEVVMTATITNPGVIENSITLTIFDDANLDVTHLYEINLFLGTLTVHARDITIQTATAEKVYDGTPLIDQTWELLSGTLHDTHHIEAVMNASNPIIGSIENTISLTIVDENNQDMTIGYNIQYFIGYLNVYPREIRISTGSDSKPYDGLPLSNSQWQIIIGSLANQHQINVVMPSSITIPGSIENTIHVTIVDGQNVEVTSYYTIHYDLGILTIETIPLVIETQSAEKIYDGTVLSNQNWFLRQGVLLENHRIEAVFTNSITYPGSISNDMGITVLDAQN
ncbi:MAG: hypothetical protein RBS87_06540, partial [Acholeplasma sp.]|nr:hypothetical protein [Acholeplasma sp.]